MKKIYHYSEKKFLGFTPQKQLAIILEMLEVLEKNFEFKEYALVLQESLSKCFSFLGNSLWSSYDLTKLTNVINLRDDLLEKQAISLRDSDIIIKRYDSVKSTSSKFPVVLILDNLRSAFNVGSIIRSSECLGVTELALCGKTPGRENRKVLETSMGTADFVRIVRYESSREAVLAYREQGYEIIALELTNNSVSLVDYNPAEKVALILGNESLGVAEDILELCDTIVEIEMRGIKNSLNVSNATAIATHVIIQKMEEKNDK